MRLIVTGTQGQIARALIERGPLHGVDIVAIGRPELDLAEPARAQAAIEAAAGDIVVNAAAYTAVDKAELEPALALRINCEGAAAVARGAAKSARPILHLSTDYVFSGDLDRPYREDDATGPSSAYGHSKLAGERAVVGAHPGAVVLRTAWVYSPFGANFLRTMLRLGQTRDTVGVVADQLGTPTSALDIADALIALAERLVKAPDADALAGVYHMTGAGEATWADFAEAIFAEAARRGSPQVSVRRISTADYPTPARRPANSRLSSAKLARAFGVVLPDWRVSARLCVARLTGASQAEESK